MTGLATALVELTAPAAALGGGQRGFPFGDGVVVVVMRFETGPQIEPCRGEEPVEGRQGRLAGPGFRRCDGGLNGPGPGGQLSLSQPGPGAGIEDQHPRSRPEHVIIHPAAISRIAYEHVHSNRVGGVLAAVLVDVAAGSAAAIAHRPARG